MGITNAPAKIDVIIGRAVSAVRSTYLGIGCLFGVPIENAWQRANSD